MRDLEDFIYDDIEYEYEQSIIDEAFENGTVESMLKAEGIYKLLTTLYADIPIDLSTKELCLNRFENELEICKQLLKPIATDIMPLIRQVEVFKNLVNLEFPKPKDMYYDAQREGKIFNLYNYSYHNIIECVLVSTNVIKLEINPLIPKKHYEKTLKEIYVKSSIKSLNIPIENPTVFLQELFDIWIQHSVYGKTAYQIAENFVAYATNGKAYDKTQIQRKIKSIKQLIKK